jgi:hypothetical protein
MLSGFMFSHTLNYNKIVLRHWSIQKNNTFIDGSFSKFKNGLVSIEDAQNIESLPFYPYLEKVEYLELNKIF